MSKEEIKRIIMIGVEIAKENYSLEDGCIVLFDDETIEEKVKEEVEYEY